MTLAPILSTAGSALITTRKRERLLFRVSYFPAHSTSNFAFIYCQSLILHRCANLQNTDQIYLCCSSRALLQWKLLSPKDWLVWNERPKAKMRLVTVCLVCLKLHTFVASLLLLVLDTTIVSLRFVLTAHRWLHYSHYLTCNCLTLLTICNMILLLRLLLLFMTRCYCKAFRPSKA